MKALSIRQPWAFAIVHLQPDLGRNADGQPKHPLYLAASTQFSPIEAGR